MKVSELIEILQKCNPDVDVDFAHHRYCTSPIEWVQVSIEFPEVRLYSFRPSWQEIQLSIVAERFKK